MCGIAGIVDFKKPPLRSDLKVMLHRIQYRGPDSTGVYSDDHCAMGTNRLSIIDLKTGDQPISSHDGRFTIVFNGEIYNFKKLRESLKQKGYRFKTRSDTEVILRLFEHYHDASPKMLNGMFSFAIWDKLNQELFLARDPVGIKPFYFAAFSQKLIFGSELKAILSCRDLVKKIDRESIHCYLSFGYFPAHLTPFSGVKKLPSGHWLKFSKKNLNIQKYWQLDSTSYSNLDQLLNQSVTDHLIADVPVGIFLSGGLDSSLIAYYACRNHPKIKTFTMGFNKTGYDETITARKTSAMLHTTHFEDSFSSDDIIRLSSEIWQKMDEPLSDPSLFPTYKLSKFARGEVKVVLSGDGGDELFTGYPQYIGHWIAQILNFLPEKSTKLMNRFSFLAPISFGSYSKTEVFMRATAGIKLPLLIRHFFWMLLFSSAVSKGDYLKLLNRLKRQSWFDALLNDSSKISSNSILQCQFLDLQTYLRDFTLVKSDRASMFNSLEVRVPFLDNRLLNFAFTQSNPELISLSTKNILRKLVSTKLPGHLNKQKKKGFGMPIDQWLRTSLKNFGFEILSNRKLFDYVSENHVKELWTAHQKGRTNNSRQLWLLISFSAWLKNWYE